MDNTNHNECASKINTVGRTFYSRLAILRFPLIVGVVFIHAQATVLTFSGSDIGVQAESSAFLPAFVIRLVATCLASLAVPMFFLISAFLFYDSYTFTPTSYCEKLKRRFHSLFIPFVFWNVAVLLIFFIAQNIPAIAVNFSGKNKLISDYSIWDVICGILGIGRMPIAYQFWFIRDLILLVICSPLIGYLVQRLSLSLVFLLVALWFLADFPESALFFTIGAYFAIHKKSLFFGDRYFWWLAALCLLLMCGAATYVNPSSAIATALRMAGILVGCFATFSLTAFLQRSPAIEKSLLLFGGSSFFIFATHEPLLVFVRKLVYRFLQPDNPYEILGLFFLIPICLIIALMIVHRFMKFLLPTFTNIISGGR